jgi:hypothetical protein
MLVPNIGVGRFKNAKAQSGAKPAKKQLSVFPFAIFASLATLR